MSIFDEIRKVSSAGDATRNTAGDSKGSRPARQKRLDPETREKAPAVPRDARGRLLPGYPSLNPGGRSLGAAARARAILEDSSAWDFLEGVADGREDVDPKLRLEVILRLQDRAYGKAASVQLTAELPTEAAQQMLNLDALPPEIIAEKLNLERKVNALRAGQQVVEAELVETPALPAGEPIAADGAGVRTASDQVVEASHKSDE